MQEKYNVGIYCRLSRDDERTGESVSIENQKIMLSRYVQEQGWTLYAAYCDDGVSGTTFDRPMFNQMIADAKAGKINLILCKDLSRLGRDYIEAGRFTDIVFPSMGCRFIALNDGVDTIHKNNEMLVILKNVMNEFYARDTSKKIRAVKQAKAQRGERVNGEVPYGYLLDPNDRNHLIPDPETAYVVKQIFAMYVRSDRICEIQNWLRENEILTVSELRYQRTGSCRHPRPHPNCIYNWPDKTLYDILGRKEYLGHTLTGKSYKISYKSINEQIQELTKAVRQR